jgi:hypothetical protein
MKIFRFTQFDVSDGDDDDVYVDEISPFLDQFVVVYQY